ncbi:MAG TPA: NAD(P)H-dependent oxidoreductase [Candidatus Saccharimonadales bacterium]|nr:NAD(P)H-dependent oxidoreductase [Candidatus Saccharimonadales bacterium]
MDKKIKILGILGSLRKNSYNKSALEIAASVVPENAEIEIYDRIGEIPLFNQDLEKTPPDVVKELKEKVRSADAILFATPEYNYSIPGGLKNAIDWVSRPYGDNAWEGKIVGIMSASISMLGGGRAQYHLRQTFVFLDMHPLNRPEVMIPSAAEKFDEQGNLTDTHTKEKIAELLQALVQKSRTRLR